MGIRRRTGRSGGAEPPSRIAESSACCCTTIGIGWSEAASIFFAVALEFRRAAYSLSVPYCNLVRVL
jgi:hypothetical protein